MSAAYAGLKLLRACRRAEGLCAGCPNTTKPNRALPGRKMCRRCLRYYAAAAQRVIASRKTRGLCPQCGGAKGEKYYACLDCRRKAAIRARRSRSRRIEA